MNDWCVSRGMSWQAVAEISNRWDLSFEQVPCAGDNFYAELARVRPDWNNQRRWPRDGVACVNLDASTNVSDPFRSLVRSRDLRHT